MVTGLITQLCAFLLLICHRKTDGDDGARGQILTPL